MAAFLTAFAARPSHGDYTVERVVDGLNQPMYVTQAPGDNSSLYVVEREDAGGQLGRIRKFDLQTQSFSTFLDVGGQIISDGGLLSMTFHPEFETNGRFYVVSNNAGVNGLDEYQVVNDTPQFQRRLIQYNNLNNVFHTMNQAFFRPGGDSDELFVTTGDGGTQANDPGFDPELIEDPTSLYGKVLKVDLSEPFASPADEVGQGVSLVALGIRNPYRSSFDSQTGDFYIGDVGYNTAESVDFIHADHFADPDAEPLNFGWTDREGTAETNASQAGGPKEPGDIDPIFDYAHDPDLLPHESLIFGGSVTGGYVYRGPVPELHGRYFFADFLNGNVYSGEFDRTTDPSTFDGTNLTDLQDHTSEFEASIGGGADIEFLTSFAEDNAGNLYMVKFGGSFFPPLGEGELFRISPVLSDNIVVEVDRETGAISLANATGEALEFSSLTLTSARGAIDPDALTPITGNYDAGGAVDDDPWQITSPADSHTIFSEESTGDGGALGGGEEIALSPEGGWLPSPNEDLFASLLLGDGSVLNATVDFTGNGGAPFERSDLDFSGDVSLADWSVFVDNAFTSLDGLSGAEAYARGDLDGDGDNDYADFLLFKSDYNAVHGAGAFEAAVAGVPEPHALALAVVCAAVGASGRRRSSTIRVTD